MDSNGNQRKRGGRMAKNANADEKSSPQNIEHNEVMEVPSVAISPTLEETESAKNAPPSECRRSSRKKIIKFDVRDLLNKNRKTHKIQIEARIDSNAPTTSKASTETVNLKTSSTTSREDLLSKHKTFLEKSAIFRRYSVSQEHKAPPPPLPIPPLLGKANDKDSGFSGTSSCQEFLSNALIKPKQPTSLIVAQIESNKPSSAATAKRKNIYKSLETKFVTTSETPHVIQQKKRGRPAKIKTQSLGTVLNTSVQEEYSKRKITPEKAKNWKEYKACLAQQSSSINKVDDKAISIFEHQKDETPSLFKKKDELRSFDDTLQSDISRSDDDGNFSGFQTSKDDISCDSPVLEKIFAEKSNSIKEIFNKSEPSENINNEMKVAFKDVESKCSTELNEKEPSFKAILTQKDAVCYKKETSCIQILDIPLEKDLNLEIETENVAIIEPEVMKKGKIQKENEYRKANVKRLESNSDKNFEKVGFKKSNSNSPDLTQQKESENEIDVNASIREINPIEEKQIQYKPPAKSDLLQDAQKSYATSQENEIINKTDYKQQMENKCSMLRKENIKDIPTNSRKVEHNTTEELADDEQSTILKKCITTAYAETSTNSQTFETLHETRRELNTPDISSKSYEFLAECTIDTKHVSSPLPSTFSDETKSFSRTSSSSESENTSERSSYSSEPFSTTSSSSPRSYKSGDKLKVSVKRISLPKSPSTSSQTSTSEEFNNTDVLKRKPPIAKRSKRLQHKFKETLDSEDHAENIDCFQRIENDDKKHEINLDERISIEDVSNAEILPAPSKLNIEEVVTPELVQNVVDEPITKYATQDCCEIRISSEITDALSDESANVEYLSGKEKTIKRKSLRNRYNKDSNTDVTKSKDKETQPEAIQIKQQQILANENKNDKEKEENFEIYEEKTAIAEKNVDYEKSSGSEQSDKSEDNEQKRRSKKFQSEIQLCRKKLEKPLPVSKEQISNLEDKKEILIVSTETKIQEENISSEEAVKSTNIENKEEKVQKLYNEYKLSILNEATTVAQTSDSCENITEKNTKGPTISTITIAEEIPTKVVCIRSGIQGDLDNKDGQQTDPFSKEIETENLDKTKAPARTKTNLEIGNKLTLTKSKTDKDEVYINESKSIEENLTKSKEEILCAVVELKSEISAKKKAGKKSESISEVVQVETAMSSRDTNKPSNQKLTAADKEKSDNITTVKNKTNKDNKLADDEVKEASGREHTTQTSIRKTCQEDKVISEIIKVPICGSNQDKTDKETIADNLEKDSTITSTMNESIKGTEIIKENYENVEVLSTKDKKNAVISEIMVVVNLGCIQAKTKTPSDNSTLTTENVAADKLEKVLNISTRSRSNKEEISAMESSCDELVYPIHDSTQVEVRTKDELKKGETSATADVSKTLKEGLFTNENKLAATEISSAKSKPINKEYSTEVSKNLEHKSDGKLSKANLQDKEIEKSTTNLKIDNDMETKSQCNKPVLSAAEDMVAANQNDLASVIPSTKSKTDKEEISPSNRKRSTSKKGPNSHKLSTNSNENVENPNIEVSSPASSSKSLQDKNVAAENRNTEQSPATKNISPKLSLPASSTKTVLCKHTDSDKSHATVNVSDTVELIKETTASNAQQESLVPENNEKVLVIPIVAKRRGRKPRFKNLHGPEVDSGTDSSNGKSTPIDEIAHQKQNTESKSPQKEKVHDKEIQNSSQTFSETDTKVGEIEKKHPDVNVIEENNQTNLLSSQIKNVSIETNTLLDILRTVQSNTEAALKASKSPINIDITDNENAIEEPPNNSEDSLKIQQESESSTKLRCHNDSPKNTEDSLKMQRESEITSPTLFDTESSLTAKKLNLSSPARSESASPLTLKKVTPSPTRSNSSSPLTLKKVTRRYERRSRRGDEPAHKTLEETFAEIAAQSSKAVLAAKEFDINEEQTKNEQSPNELDIIDTNEEQSKTEKSQKELDVIDTAPNFEKEQIEENFAELEKTSGLEDVEKKVDETLLNVAQDIDKAPVVSREVVINSTENLVEIEKSKLTPTRRGRKPKNKTLDVPMTETKETLEINEAVKTTEGSTITKEVGNENKIHEVTEVIAKEKEDENKIKKLEKVNESLEISTTGDLSESTSKSTLSSMSNQQVDSKEDYYSLPPTTVEESSKQLEDVGGDSILSKKIKKRDTKAVLDEDTLVSTIDTCQDREEENRTPKQPIKKRDSSLSKSETKSVGKKIGKKTKNEEDDALNLQKEESLTKTAATTPPPSKRGRKPKNQQPETPQTNSKKKNKKEICIKNAEDDINVEKEKPLDSESESLTSSSDKTFDEKLAKKKRQKKLKEAFEAALTDDKEKCKEAVQAETCSATSISSFGLTLFNNSPPPEKNQTTFIEDLNESIKRTCLTPVEAEEDPDPLKDIEKFIADGVNLLKKDYKLDEDSVDDVMHTTPSRTTKIVEEPVKISSDETKHIFNTFETPADTPLNTPSATPPPKSPTSIESITPDEHFGVRRSHRIKLITKTPKALVGRGLVRDRERFSIKDDVETKSHYTMDDHLTDLAEVEAKNSKFLKEMEERLSNFQVIKENDYLCERVISREARKMICDCFLTHEEEGRGELGCGEDCLNRLLMIECGPECNVKERCTNKRFQKLLCSPCRVFRTEKKGFGIMADIEILPGEFIMEYVGEVIDTEEFEKRRIMYSQDKNRHYYFMALRSDAIIDATIKGNISRFINHSCDPNAETQKWTVNGELRIGFFSRKSIMPGEEITFNYQYQRYGREAQRCYCESSNCRGWIGQEPTSDEGEQLDDEYDESEDEEEEADTSNLLVQDDDEDSDASVADPEEVQKQLEMAAAQAEVELAPLQLLEQKVKQVESASEDGKSIQDLHKSGSEEDSKSKFKKLLSKMAEKVAAKQKQNKRELKLQRKKKSKESSSELTNKLRFLEDPDIEDEVEFLKECGLKNQSDTLRLSRLMVRAKLVQTRLNLLEILRKGDLPCRRLFLDYHGLRLLHGWMSEDAGNMQIRLSLLQTLETLPIANKTVLTDSKVMQAVRNWCGTNTNLSPAEDSSSSNSNSQDAPVQSSATFEEGSEMAELQKLALKLITTWEGLPEIFRIPKKERIEQMKEHEREADRQYAANAESQENTTATDRYRRDRFGRGLNTPNNTTIISKRFVKPNNGNPHKNTNTTPENLKNLSKAQRREMFAAKVARDEAEKRLAEERREFETKCRFFGLDPKKTRPQDMPFCVNPATGQWFSIERKPIATPPSYAHVQVPVKLKSTDPNDYQLPAVCSSLPSQWKYAITPQGKIYYYHIKQRMSQWEPPSPAQLQQCELEAMEEDSESEISTTAGEDSSDDDDDILIGMDAAQLKAYIDRKVEMRRQKRYHRLVDQRCISPRREEDRIYNQLEVRKYKENKEKIRKRKEDIRRKRAEALRQTPLNTSTMGSTTDTGSNSNKSNTEIVEEVGALPIQDYLLSSDEEVDLKAEVNSPLIDKIVEGDKIVDELDALTSKRQLKRPLPPHRDFNEPSTSFSSISTSVPPSTLAAKQEYKKRKLEKKEKRKPKEQDAKYRKNKEKFRCEIAGIIVHHLKPYLKETCSLGRIQSNEDFNHLARKLTHFVMIKELKYCESVGQILVVTESVKSKSREFIKKYMAKYGEVYIKPTNDPDFKDIPFTL